MLYKNEVSLCMVDPLIFLDHCVTLTLAVVLSLCSKQSFILLSLSMCQVLDTGRDKHLCMIPM